MPRELDLLFEADADVARDAYGPAACIQSLLANIYRDQEKKPDPYTPADFLPGAKNSEEDDWRDFIEKCRAATSSKWIRARWRSSARQ